MALCQCTIATFVFVRPVFKSIQWAAGFLSFVRTLYVMLLFVTASVLQSTCCA